MESKKISNVDVYGNQVDNHYYEVAARENEDTVTFYLENNARGTWLSVNSNTDGFVVKTNDIELGRHTENYKDNRSIFESIVEYIILNRDLFKDFKKLKNGYVWNNEYFESYREIIWYITEQIKKKNLEEKFMTNGLTLDDFSVEMLEK